MESTFRLPYQIRTSEFQPVSILVLMESTFRQHAVKVSQVGCNEVSILVLMESTFRQSGRKEKEHGIKVSILVLMESTFRPSGARTTLTKQLGFNPCFNGINIQTYSYRYRPIHYAMFQSLF